MDTNIKTICTEKVPAPKGAYSQGCVHNSLVYVAGQLPLEPATGEVVPGDFGEHVKQSLRNVKAVLEAGGSDLSHVLKINIYLSDASQFALVNQAYEEIMPKPYPPRTTRAVALGPFDVEIDAIGVVCKETI